MGFGMGFAGAGFSAGASLAVTAGGTGRGRRHLRVVLGRGLDRGTSTWDRASIRSRRRCRSSYPRQRSSACPLTRGRDIVIAQGQVRPLVTTRNRFVAPVPSC